MPGMLIAAPLRTLTRSGSAASPNFFPKRRLDELQTFHHVVPGVFRQLTAVFVILGARLRAHRESRGNGESDSSHLCEVTSFSPKGRIYIS